MNFNELQLDALLADMEKTKHVCDCGSCHDEESCDVEDVDMEDNYFDPADSLFGSEAVQSPKQSHCENK